MRATLNQDDFRVRRCGERNGADGGYGGHAVWALEALSSRSAKRSIMFRESIISYWLLLSPGWRTIPTPPPLCLGVRYLVFSLYWMQKSLDVCFPPIFLLTPQACKMPYVPGILESVKGTDRDKIPPPKHLWRKPKLPRTRKEEPGAAMTQPQIVQDLIPLSQPKQLFCLKQSQWPIDCWDMF